MVESIVFHVAPQSSIGVKLGGDVVAVKAVASHEHIHSICIYKYSKILSSF